MTRLMKTLHVREVSTMPRGTTILRGTTVPTYNTIYWGSEIWIHPDLNGLKEVVLQMVWIWNGI